MLSSKKGNLIIGADNHSKFRWWYIAIAILVIIIIAIAGGYAYINAKLHNGTVNIPNVKNAPIIVSKKQQNSDVENILIMGIDMGPANDISHRADMMCVASIHKKTNTLKLASILRDIKVYFPDKKFYGKLNASYNYGGPNETVNMVNSNFKLDIQKYVVIDFSGFSKIIDTVGGVPINLTAKEAAYSYINVGQTAGTYNLDGAHALGYVRTREIDTDFLRTQRQRNVMFAVINKFKNVGIATKLSVANECLGDIQTNIPTTELMGSMLTFESKMNANIPQLEIPTMDDGMYTTETHPQWYWDLDWSREVPKLDDFLYNN